MLLLEVLHDDTLMLSTLDLRKKSVVKILLVCAAFLFRVSTHLNGILTMMSDYDTRS